MQRKAPGGTERDKEEEKETTHNGAFSEAWTDLISYEYPKDSDAEQQGAGSSKPI